MFLMFVMSQIDRFVIIIHNSVTEFQFSLFPQDFSHLRWFSKVSISWLLDASKSRFLNFNLMRENNLTNI